jgi:CBS domain-containing protein
MTIARILAAKGGDVVTTQPHRTLAEVAEVLVAKNIGAVVVVADVQGSVIGILSERDIVRAVAKRGTAVFNDAVSMHMTAEVITTSEDERVHVAMEKMTNGRFRHLPVIRHERLVGLVSIGDLVKHRLAEYEYEQKVTREYIATA